jgi:hypothetical protein
MAKNQLHLLEDGFNQTLKITQSKRLLRVYHNKVCKRMDGHCKDISLGRSIATVLVPSEFEHRSIKLGAWKKRCSNKIKIWKWW